MERAIPIFLRDTHRTTGFRRVQLWNLPFFMEIRPSALGTAMGRNWE